MGDQFIVFLVAHFTKIFAPKILVVVDQSLRENKNVFDLGCKNTWLIFVSILNFTAKIYVYNQSQFKNFKLIFFSIYR